MDVWNWCVFGGGGSVIVDIGAEIRIDVFLQVDSHIPQVTVDHGFQLWDFGSRSPECDVVSIA